MLQYQLHCGLHGKAAHYASCGITEDVFSILRGDFLPGRLNIASQCWQC